MNQQLVDEVTSYVNTRSWRARRSQHTRRIVHIALSNLSSLENRGVDISEVGLQSYIRHKVLIQLKRTESWYIVQYLLHWLLDVVIELVIYWWTNRETET